MFGWRHFERGVGVTGRSFDIEPKCCAQNPQKKGVIGPTVGDRCDNRFTVVGTATALSELSLSQFTLVEVAGKVTGVISALEIASFVLKFSHQDGIFELSTSPQF